MLNMNVFTFEDFVHRLDKTVIDSSTMKSKIELAQGTELAAVEEERASFLGFGEGFDVAKE